MAGYPAIDDGRPGYALDESARASTISAHIAGALVRTREQRRRETVARYPTTPRRNVLRPGRSTHVRVHCSEACSFADRPDPTVRAAAVEALVVSAAQDRSVVSFADGEIGPTAARCKVTPKGLADPRNRGRRRAYDRGAGASVPEGVGRTGPSRALRRRAGTMIRRPASGVRGTTLP